MTIPKPPCTFNITDEESRLIFKSKKYKLVFTIDGEITYYKDKLKLWTSNTREYRKDQYGNLEDIVVEFTRDWFVYMYYKRDRKMIWSNVFLDSLKTYHFPRANFDLLLSDDIEIDKSDIDELLPDYNKLKIKLLEIGIKADTVDKLKNLKISNYELNKIM